MKSKIDFKSPCPGKNCPSPEPNRIIEWSHASCSGSEEWLTNEGNIVCKTCDKSFFILDASFACKYHRNEYMEAGYTQLANCISILITNPDINESDLAFLMLCSQRIKARAKEKGII